MRHFLSYAAQFLGNTGNFKSFGDSKFIPRIPAEEFEKLAKASPEAEKLYTEFKDELYESTSSRMHLGFPDKGHVTTYYPDSPNITQAEIESIADFLKRKKLMPENTRLRQTASGDFELLIASAITDPTTRDIDGDEFTLEGSLKGKKLQIKYGDHHAEMAKIVRWLSKLPSRSPLTLTTLGPKSHRGQKVRPERRRVCHAGRLHQGLSRRLDELPQGLPAPLD